LNSDHYVFAYQALAMELTANTAHQVMKHVDIPLILTPNVVSQGRVTDVVWGFFIESLDKTVLEGGKT
jgi:hypothetical protein